MLFINWFLLTCCTLENIHEEQGDNTMMPIYGIDHLFSLCALQRLKMSPHDSNFHLLCPRLCILIVLDQTRSNCKEKIYLVQACQFSETWQQKIGGHWKKSGPFCLLPCLNHHFFSPSIWPCSTNHNLFIFQKQGVKGTPLPRAQSHLKGLAASSP